MILRRRLVPFLALPGVLRAFFPGKEAPNFAARSMDGERFTRDSLKGRVVLIQFWATWCGYCRRDEPAVESVLKSFQSKGLTVLAVNVGESKRKVQDYLQSHPRTPKIVLTEDTNLAALFPPDGYPSYLVLDREGRIAGTQSGAGGEEALRDLLKKAGLS